MRLSRLAGKSAGWDSKGPGSIPELEVQVVADKSCIPPVICGKSWQSRDNIGSGICSCQVIGKEYLQGAGLAPHFA